jgi:hypothetical protein
MMEGKDVDVNSIGLILRYNSGICEVGLKKPGTTFSGHFVYLTIFEPGQRSYKSGKHIRRQAAPQATFGTLFCDWHKCFN